MQFQLACRQRASSVAQRARLRFAATMADDVIGIAFKRNIRMVPCSSSNRTHSGKDSPTRTDLPTLAGVPFSRLTTVPSGMLTGAAQPSFDAQQHLFAVRMMVHGPHHQLPVDAIEEAFDVEIQYPVVLPAPTPCHVQRLMGRSARTVAVESLWKCSSTFGSKYRLDHHLGDSVRDRRNA